MRVARSLALLLAAVSTSAAAETSSAGKYPHYYAARDAAERGDCKALLTHLDAFLRKHPYVPEKYPDFFFELRYVRQQCSEGFSVRGIEGESEGIDPLPEDLPMSE